MNAERLHVIARAIQEEVQQINLVGRLSELVSHLQNMVNNPQQPAHQQNVSSTQTALYSALDDAPSNHFSPAWRQIVEELGGTDLLGGSLKRRLQEVFARNQITPNVALEEAQKILNEEQSFQQAISQVTAAFQQLRIGAEDLKPGECELGMLVPRGFVENKLGNFGEELEELDFIFNAFAEVVLEKRPGFEIKTISSTDLMVYVALASPVAACIAKAANELLDLYKKYLEIKKLRADMKAQGVSEKALEGVVKEHNELMGKGVEQITVEVFDTYWKGMDAGRENELRNSVRISLNKLANRIDRGFNIDIRVAPLPAPPDLEGTPDTYAEERKYVQTVQETSKNLQFMRVEGEPILSLPENGKEEGTSKVSEK